jgi:phytoene synthase
VEAAEGDLAALRAGDAACRSITRHYARTFYFASQTLPSAVRPHAYAVYGFCRWADNLVDDAPDVAEATRRVAHARTVLDRAYGDGPAPPALLAFRRTVRARSLPRDLFDALLDGMAMDLTIARYATFADLDLYCYRVAGVVGLMMTRVFGYRDERCFPSAVALGRAMQLTNILRDVREDLDRGRIYLPQDELARFGVTEDQLRRGERDDRFRNLMRFQIARARASYADSDAGVPDILGWSCRLTVRVMGRLYAGILDAIEAADHDVFTRRAHVPTAGKLARLAGCVRDELAAGTISERG